MNAAPEPNVTCDLCGDNRQPMHLHARCHLTAPLSATLENGVLTLRCYLPECRRVVARFNVSNVNPTNGATSP